ncbi:MAG: mechanosensitive ion channel family protein [Cyanobacteria bacterium SBLK]|nr:mechanosensitive ion channel family protein [Cyanobacteria bacterium SBLK]
MTTMTINIITIVAEVSLILIFLFLIDWLFGRLYRQIFKLPFLAKSKNSAEEIRRSVRGFLLFLSLILSIAIIGANGFLIYRGENVRDYSLELLQRIPQEVWIAIGWRLAQCLGIIIVASLILGIVNRVLKMLSKSARNFDKIAEDDENIVEFFKFLKNTINAVSWMAIAIICAQILLLPEAIANNLYIFIRIYIIISSGVLVFKVLALTYVTIAIALAVFQIATIISQSVAALNIKSDNSDSFSELYAQLRPLIPLFKRALEFIIYITIATLVVRQIEAIADLGRWGPVAIKLIAIALIGRIIISIVYFFEAELLLGPQDLTPTQRQRRETITPLLQSISKYLIYFGAGIWILDTVGIDPAPILAGAGIVGLAVGFGAQNLVNDIVSGFFILFENYYLVGDYIEAGELSGYVESIELRTTRIRHHHGQVHILRNGDITSITNYSKEFVYAAVDIGVDYATNLDRVYEIAEAIGKRLQAENEDVLEPTQVEGIEEFDDIRIILHTKTKVKPGKHLQIQRILRKRYKEEFDLAGIYIPIAEASDKPDWATKGEQQERDRIEKLARWRLRRK